MSIKLRSMASIYLLREDQILLLYRQGGRVVSDVWIGSAGGHIEPEEAGDPQSCALREMQEELGLSADEMTPPQLRYVTMRMVNGEIRQNFYYFAHLKAERELCSNEGTLRWFPLDELDDLPMAYTAGYMLKHWLSAGRYTDCVYGGISDGEKVVFTTLHAY